MRTRFALAALLTLGSAAAQKFEVASIKPNAANDNRVMFRMAPGGTVNITGVTLRQLIAQAYDMRDFQISGGPGWIGADHWDINAKAEEGAAPPSGPAQMQATMRAMMRNLLEERFALKVRQETKEMPAYILVTARNGPKLKEVEGGAGPQQNQRIRMGRGLIESSGMPLGALAQQISQQVGRPVVDKTGLTGLYAVELKFTPEPGQGGMPGPPPPPDAPPAADNGGPTIFTALQEQLGLRLESQKTSVPVLIIEGANRPTEN
jgi:uncharacterized protein (TIGR03435 family)